MTVDTTLIGETAASLMESLPDEVEGDIIAVGLVVIVDDRGEDGGTYTRIKCSQERFYEQLGIFHAALSCVESGTDADDGGNE